MSTIIRGSGDTTFGGTIQSTGIDDNATSTAITIDASENVGVGTSSPSAKLHIKQSDGTPATGSKIVRYNNDAQYLSQWTNGGAMYYDVVSDYQPSFILRRSLDSGSTFSESMRIDSSGNLLVGKTTTAFGTAGSRFMSNGQIQSIASGQELLGLNRLTSDGDLAKFYKDSVLVGSIQSYSGIALAIGTGATGLRFHDSLDIIIPHNIATNSNRDNSVDLGYSSVRFDDIYATNGTIQTSDRNEKQDIEELSVAETAVATACKGLLRKFRWQDSVAEKGDDARIHFGIIAQDLQDAFAAEGLDAGDYAMFISTTWYEKLVPVDAVIGVEAVEATYDDEGNELTPAVEAVEAKDAYIRTDTEDEPTAGYTERTRLGVRYPELLAFIISAI